MKIEESVLFEYKIQEAWDDYKTDFGLGRISLYICLYNAFLFFFAWVFLGHIVPLALIPIVISSFFYFFRSHVIKKDNLFIFCMNSIPLIITIILNYYLIGEFDRLAGSFTRLDPYFSQFDIWVFGMPLAKIIEELFVRAGLLGTFFYDLMMIGYLSYFLLPIFVGAFYYRELPRLRKYKIGRYFSSVIIYFSLNYLFYLSVPVTGPQFFHLDLYSNPLPFSVYGEFLHGLVQNGQTTFIDCFPSGHFGISVLVTIWMFKINHRYRFLITFITSCILCATLFLRFHYTLDILASIPLALLCYKLSWILFPVEVSPTHFRLERDG